MHGYAAFSVSHSMEGAVRSYILSQEAHHQRASFEQELVALLEKHEMEFKPEYLFD